MLEPGEKVAAAANMRNFVLVFGEHGTVIKVTFDHETNQPRYQRLGDLGHD